MAQEGPAGKGRASKTPLVGSAPSALASFTILDFLLDFKEGSLRLGGPTFLSLPSVIARSFILVQLLLGARSWLLLSFACETEGGKKIFPYPCNKEMAGELALCCSWSVGERIMLHCWEERRRKWQV